MSVQSSIEMLGGAAAVSRFKALPEKGAFAVSASTDMRVVSNGTVYPIDVNSKVVFTVADFKKEVHLVIGHNDLRGVNKRLISADLDTVDVVALRSFVSKAYSVKTDLRTGWTYSAEYTPVCDSHVTFIYNMLTSWYKAILWKAGVVDGTATKANGDTPATFTIRRYNYTDSHVTISHGDGEGPRVDVEVRVEQPSSADPAGDDGVDPFTFNSQSTERGEVLLLPHISKHAYTWYIKHVVRRTSTSVLNFEVPVPGLSLQNLAVRTTNGNDAQYEPEENLDWTDSDSMWYWLAAYVTENRVESHFGAAFELFCSMAYRPVADSAEGFLYSEIPTVIHLPQPHYYRARFPGLLEDEPWMVPHDAHSVMLRAGADVHGMLAMAGVTNYVAHIGAVGITMEGLMVEANRKLAMSFSLHSNTYLSRPSEHRAGCTFAVLGREITTHFTGGIGVTYPTVEINDIGRYPHARASTRTSDTSGFDLTGAGLAIGNLIPLPASPALLYGKCSDQITALGHCRPMLGWELSNGRDTILSLEQAYALANVYRLAGYDAAFQSVQSGQSITPFSSLDAMSLSLTSMEFDPRVNTTYLVNSFSPRNKERLMRLPTPEAFMDMRSLDVNSTTAGYTMERPEHRGASIITNYRRARELKRIVVRVAPGSILEEITVTKPTPKAHQPTGGFHSDQAVNLDAPLETTALAETES